MFKRKKRTKVHFVGIGGIGMSGIAEVLVNLGYFVSGSDIARGASVARLEKMGCDVKIGHHADHIGGADVVVYSSAISSSNPEFEAAKKLGIPLIQRAEMLSELMRLKYGIAVAGTHGKTTTTSFLATILHECHVDPTHIIGGVVENLGGHAKVGKGDFIVAEADESDGTFLLLSPVFSIITNIECDHMEYYCTEKRLHSSFVKFANKIPFYGKCAINIDDKGNQQIKKKIKRPIVTFGIKKNKDQYDYHAININHLEFGSEFNLCYRGEDVGRVKINLPGEHNVYNALGALAIAHQLDLDFDQIIKGVEKCRGVGRRFDLIYTKNDFEVLDDYAHHPTEIQMTIETARKTRDKKVIVVYQPHRFSRIENSWKDLLHSFNNADSVYITPIYSAGEEPIIGINSDRLVMDINNLHPGLAQMLDKAEDIGSLLTRLQSESAIVLVMGAGSISRIARESVGNLQ